MELTFEKVGNQYIAEFQAPSDFNLHIEREEIGVLEVHQRGSEEGKYDFAWSTGVSGRKVVDYDFGALVYPKWIKVVSGSEVVSASVNFNEGGGSGNGDSSENNYLLYYKFDEPQYVGSDVDEGKYPDVFAHLRHNGVGGVQYGSTQFLQEIIGSVFSNPIYIDAFAFIPFAFKQSTLDELTILNTYEDVRNMIDVLPTATRITAEEYWEHFNAE